MVTAAWDTSSLVALYKNGVQCETCCQFVPPLDDCCCFLDPDTNAWDGGITYDLDDLAESGGKTYGSLQGNNLNHAVGDGDWWVVVSDSVSCENADWDAISPFGGPGRTPAFYTLNFKVTWAVSGLVTTYHSDSLEWDIVPAFGKCFWHDDTTQESAGETVIARLFLRGRVAIPTTDTVIAVRNTNRSCDPANLGGAGDTIINVASVIGPCVIEGDFGCANDGVTCCLIRSTGPLIGEWEAGTIVLSWRPGQIPAWDSGTGYMIGDIVAHEGVFYQCIADHTNQEPPNATYWVVI